MSHTVTRARVALQSTVASHGLPYPHNLRLARRIELAVRAGGADPATVAILAGQPRAGLTDLELQHLATAPNVRTVGRRDLAIAVARRLDGVTTAAATMFLAHHLGIPVFSTGGIGGVQRGRPADAPADLLELTQTPVIVVCSGVTATLDLPLTLEWLETHGVPVVGYQTDELPAFYRRTSGLPVDVRVEGPAEVAALYATQRQLGLPAGLLVGVPAPAEAELADGVVEPAVTQALAEAEQAARRGEALASFLRARVSELTGQAGQRADLALLENNARIAAQIALALNEAGNHSGWP